MKRPVEGKVENIHSASDEGEGEGEDDDEEEEEEEKKEEEEEDEEEDFSNKPGSHNKPMQLQGNTPLLVVGLAVLVGLCLVSLLLPTSDKKLPTLDKKEMEEEDPVPKRLKEEFSSLRLKFSNQTTHFWSVCLAAIRPILENPKHPGVILLAGSRRTTTTLNCLAHEISKAVSYAFAAFDPVVVDCRQYSNMAADEAKYEMDGKLTTAFEDGAKVAVIYDVDSLPGNSPMIFYRFCDTANAPFKTAVIILTLNMEKEATSESETDAYNEMTRLWSPVLDEDQVRPLFSRIGNSIAYVREEKDTSSCTDDYTHY